jgi:radical SAM superfamily enzyme YgiQ (UPF0313 family)
VRPDHIWFADDIFGLKPGWLQRFADLVQDVRTPFKSLSRADLLLRDGEIDALARAGCDTVWMGAESGSQKVLDAMEKGIRVEWIVEASRRLRHAGIRVGFFIQFGYPGEGRGEIEQTLDLIRVAQPDDIGISVSYRLPGTKFHDNVRAQLGTKRNWEDSNDLAMLYEGRFPTSFYRTLHTVVHKEFRARQAGRELARLVRRPMQLRLRHVRRAASGAYHAATLPAARLQLSRHERRWAVSDVRMPAGMREA